MLIGLMADWALRRAWAFAFAAEGFLAGPFAARDRDMAERLLARAEWWHGLSGWLDGVGRFPRLRKGGV